MIASSLQGSEYKRIQEFGLGVVQKRNVQTHGHMFSSSDTNFSNRSFKNLKKTSGYLFGSRNGFPSAKDSNVSTASAVNYS